MNITKITKLIRSSLLILFLVMVSVAAYLHQVNGGAKSPSIHALCPFGGLESLYSFLQDGTFISKVFAGTLILFLITIVLALIFRRSFCGLLCPFGTLQELLGKLRDKTIKRRFIIPDRVDKPLRYLKYAVLVITVLYAWKTAGLWMAPYDPWSAYGHLFTANPLNAIGDVAAESLVGLILLVVTIIGSFLYDRFFCKYLCPMSAFYGIIGKISPFRITRNTNSCISCGKCNKVCPMNIDVQNTSSVKTAECIDCQLCVLSCPQKGALETSIFKRVIHPMVTIILVVGLFFGSILIFQSLGFYELKPSQPAAGQIIPAEEVKGYMTIKEAAAAMKLDLKDFYGRFKIPDSVSENTQMKQISDIVPGYDFHAIKESLQ